MKSVLVVDDDRVLLDALAQELRRLGYVARNASSVDEALGVLASSVVDVLVTDLRMRGRDGIDLLRACRELYPRTRMVLMSAYATARDYKVARSVGAVEVLVKPFAPEEFAEAVRRAESFDAGFQADVLGLTLVDVLQLFHHGRRSVVVRLGDKGALHMREGEIIHAQTETASGATALIELLSIEGGVISTGAPEQVTQSLTRPFETLLLGTMALIDERRASRPVHDGDIFTSAQPLAIEAPVAEVRSTAPRRPPPLATETRPAPPVKFAPSAPPVIPLVVPKAAAPTRPPAAPAAPTQTAAPKAPAIPAPSPTAPAAPRSAAQHNRGLALALLAVFSVVLLLTLGRAPRTEKSEPRPPGTPAPPTLALSRPPALQARGATSAPVPAPASAAPETAASLFRSDSPPPEIAAPETAAPETAASLLRSDSPPGRRVPSAPPEIAAPESRPEIQAPENRLQAPESRPEAQAPESRPEAQASTAPRRPLRPRPVAPPTEAPVTLPPAPPSEAPPTRSLMPDVEILDDLDGTPVQPGGPARR